MNYPDPKIFKRLAIDIETYDPKLKEMGPGIYRKDSKILGVSISDGKFSEYYNLGHYDCGSDERKANLAYLKKVCATSIPKTGARIKYDINHLENGADHPTLIVNGELTDVQINEALLDEHQGTYSLDFMAIKYLQQRKRTTKADKFAVDQGWKGDVRNWLWKMPYVVVRDYAIGDVELPLLIDDIQQKLLEQQELTYVARLENDLLRVILQFQHNGCLIDTEKRDINAMKLQNLLEEKQDILFKEYGTFNFGSSPQVAKMCDSMKIPYSFTEKGNPQIDAAFFKLHENTYPFVKQVYDVKKIKRIVNNFLLGAFTEYVTEGNLIHCQFHNMKTDEEGTVTGRFSCTDPNLQQAPNPDRDAKDSEIFYGKLCREIFLPFPGYRWGKIDLSQIEYRMIAHYAMGPGANELRQSYIDDPLTDYHNYIVLLTHLDRSHAKNLNFGCGFGMGIDKMSAYFGWEKEYCKSINALYHTKAPYIRYTMRKVSDRAIEKGYIKTILGRRSRLLEKRKAYIMFNHLMQGSAADYLKEAMRRSYKEGLFKVLIPHLTVHDELDVSIPEGKEGMEAFFEMKNIMQTAIKLHVPVIAEASIGPNWSEQEKCKNA